MRDQIKFRVGRIVYVAFSRDETVMGVGFPKEERAAMVAAEPDKFMLPRKSDMRYNWILVRLDAIDLEELRELVIDALADVRAEKRCGDRPSRLIDSLAEGRFLGELDAGGESEFCVNVREVRPQAERGAQVDDKGLRADRVADPGQAGADVRRAAATT